MTHNGNQRSIGEILGDHSWLQGNFSVSDDQMRAQFRKKHGVEPEKVFRWKWWVYAGPEPTKSGQDQIEDGQ